MATFNGEKHIQRQLLSILAQLGSDDEVIISDDNSTDSTLAIIAQLADARIRVTPNNGHPGPMGNFEQAISRATYEMILLADQDDVWLPDKVGKMRELLQSNDLVLSDCQVVNEKGTVIHESFFRHRGSKTGFWHNLYKNSYVGCCMAFRREIMEYVLPFPPRVHMHDWWIGLLVEAKGRVCFFPEPLIQYVRHGNNVSPTGERGYGLVDRVKNRFILMLFLIKRIWRIRK
jgi:GT2 family glycosyltransferase